jgi:hypothetical protein
MNCFGEAIILGQSHDIATSSDKNKLVMVFRHKLLERCVAQNHLIAINKFLAVSFPPKYDTVNQLSSVSLQNPSSVSQ